MKSSCSTHSHIQNFLAPLEDRLTLLLDAASSGGISDGPRLHTPSSASHRYVSTSMWLLRLWPRGRSLPRGGSLRAGSLSSSLCSSAASAALQLFLRRHHHSSWITASSSAIAMFSQKHISSYFGASGLASSSCTNRDSERGGDSVDDDAAFATTLASLPAAQDPASQEDPFMSSGQCADAAAREQSRDGHSSQKQPTIPRWWQLPRGAHRAAGELSIFGLLIPTLLPLSCLALLSFFFISLHRESSGRTNRRHSASNSRQF